MLNGGARGKGIHRLRIRVASDEVANPSRDDHFNIHKGPPPIQLLLPDGQPEKSQTPHHEPRPLQSQRLVRMFPKREIWEAV